MWLVYGVCAAFLCVSVVTAEQLDYCVKENIVYTGGDLAASSAPASTSHCIFWCAENFPLANLWQYSSGVCYCKLQNQAEAHGKMYGKCKSGSLNPALTQTEECPAVINRTAWDAAKAGSTPLQHQAASIVVLHQSASCNQQSNPTACVGDIIKSLQTKHMGTGLADIGFDYLIDWTGRLYKGSDKTINPGIVKDYPKQTLNIAMIGQFNEKSAPAAAMAALKSTLDCLVADGVIASDYVIHADWSLPICGEQLYKDLTTSTLLSNYNSELTLMEKAVYDQTLRDNEVEAIMSSTTALFCELYKDDPEVRGKPPCVAGCPACIPHEEVVYILDHLDNPEEAREYYQTRGRFYTASDYSRSVLKRYIKFQLDRLRYVAPELYLTAFSKMYQHKYQVMLDAMESEEPFVWGA